MKPHPRFNFVKRRLQEGKASVGTWLSVPSPYTSEAMCRMGFDWLVVDMEHNPISIETAGLMVSSMFASRTIPLVRIPWNTGENIKRVLDMGAWGIVVPMVNSRAEAQQAVSEARYFPRGRRSVGGSRHALGFGVNAGEYFRMAHDEILIVVQIEHIDAVANVDDILSVPGIDACFIGPNDLMCSMGLAPSLASDDPEVSAAIAKVRETARKHGVAAGIHVADAATANRRIEEGFQLIAVGSELSFMLNASQTEIDRLAQPALEYRGEKQEVRY